MAIIDYRCLWGFRRSNFICGWSCVRRDVGRDGAPGGYPASDPRSARWWPRNRSRGQITLHCDATSPASWTVVYLRQRGTNREWSSSEKFAKAWCHLRCTIPVSSRRNYGAQTYGLGTCFLTSKQIWKYRSLTEWEQFPFLSNGMDKWTRQQIQELTDGRRHLLSGAKPLA